MVRRAVVAGAIVAALMAGSACSSTSSSTATASTVTASTAVATTRAELAAQAYVWGYPLVVSARTFTTLGHTIGVNHLFNQQQLSGIGIRVIVAPNQDTLYSIATVDLRNGPLVLTVPDVTDRYWTYEFLDSWTEAFDYVGTRATGGRGGTFVITPPGWTGTLGPGERRIASPTAQMFLLGRFLVSGPGDIAAVAAVTRRITLTARAAIPGAPALPAAAPALPASHGTPQTVADAGIGFFDELGDALAVNPPTDRAGRELLARLAPLGIGPGRHPGTEVTDPGTRAALVGGVTAGEARIAAYVDRNRHLVNGWLVDARGGHYGSDDLRRAAVAEVGWGENVPEEAVYPRSTVDAAGRPYDGSSSYRLHFAAGALPPVDGFWSLTVYGPDGFFTANPIDRYAIGDRTPGLVTNPDGSLDLSLSHVAPAGHAANWLPIPASGRFTLMMRLYLPRPSVLSGSWRPPGVARRS